MYTKIQSKINAELYFLAFFNCKSKGGAVM